MMLYFSTFLILGTIYLIILTVQDYRDMVVDSKYNYILLGISLGLMSHISVSIFYVLSVILTMVLFNWFGTAMRFFGKGDLSAFNWIFLGFSFINPVLILFFMVLISVIGLLYNFARTKLSIKKYGLVKPVPFYPVILASWLVLLPVAFLINPFFI